MKPTKQPASPGHRAWDVARGVQPKNAPTVLPPGFIDGNPKGAGTSRPLTVLPSRMAGQSQRADTRE